MNIDDITIAFMRKRKGIREENSVGMLSRSATTSFPHSPDNVTWGLMLERRLMEKAGEIHYCSFLLEIIDCTYGEK